MCLGVDPTKTWLATRSVEASKNYVEALTLQARGGKDLLEAETKLDEALKLAERITKNGPLAISASKEIVIKYSEWSASEMWQTQLEYLVPVFTSKDAQEGPRAFAEKREPQWTGT